MKRALRLAGFAVWWLMWPIWRIYFKNGERTRVLIVHGEDILVVRGWLGGFKWGLPGGGILPGEKTLDGALREVKEELDLEFVATTMQYLGDALHDKFGIKYRFHLYVVRLPRKMPFTKQWHEIADARWMSSKRLTKKTANHDMLRAFQLYNAQSVK